MKTLPVASISFIPPAFYSAGGRRCKAGVVWGLIFLLLTTSLPIQAQQLTSYAYTDSLTLALQAQRRWLALDSVGSAALRQGTDYPALRRRLGDAALALNRPAPALRHYGRALRENPLDSAARYGLTLAYLAFNQPAPAALVARGLSAAQRGALHLGGFQTLTQVELEGNVQLSTFERRGTAAFGRLGLSSRLSPRLTLSQDVSRFGQAVELPDPHGSRIDEQYPVRQTQYHALLGGQLAPPWRVLLGYTYLRSDFGRLGSTSGHLGYAALAYARPHWLVQAGVFAGRLTDSALVQTDLRLTVYPFGMPRLYGFGRVSVVRTAGRSHPNGVLGAGGRLRPWLWLEAYGGLGQVPALAELDGTYVYNLLDPLRRRGGASLLILLPQQLSARLSYAAEQHLDFVKGTRIFTLYSFTSALAWTW